jgi:hypothetical protein
MPRIVPPMDRQESESDRVKLVSEEEKPRANAEDVTVTDDFDEPRDSQSSDRPQKSATQSYTDEKHSDEEEVWNGSDRPPLPDLPDSSTKIPSASKAEVSDHEAAGHVSADLGDDFEGSASASASRSQSRSSSPSRSSSRSGSRSSDKSPSERGSFGGSDFESDSGDQGLIGGELKPMMGVLSDG